MSGSTGQVNLAGGTVTTTTWGSGPPDVVMLHDGLGSISQWRDVPRLVAERTGLSVMAYDRPGHGMSTPVPADNWPVDWMSLQAELLAELLGRVCVDPPLLVGHSDGGTIALLQAASNPGSVAGVLALAPHSYVEQRCVDAIAAMRRRPEPIVSALARSHADSGALFDAWSGAWVSDEFRTWDIRDRLSTITAPVLVVQGEADEYATDAMARDTAAAVGTGASWQLLPGLGHVLHHQDPQAVVDLAVDNSLKWAGRV